MTGYEEKAFAELVLWKRQMQRRPSVVNRLTRDAQSSMNRLLPDRYRRALTTALKQMVRSMLFGSRHTNLKVLVNAPLEVREQKVHRRIKIYTHTASAVGVATGFGGFFWGLADFPLWLSIKMKLIFEIAALYGFSAKDYKERIYLLHIFQIAFSSQEKRNELFETMSNWNREKQQLPDNIHDFNWHSFQEEYRDYIVSVHRVQ